MVVLRWCPTLPHPPRCSTIGAVGLSFRVRNGSGRFPHAMTAARRVDRAHTPQTGGGVCGLVVDRIVVVSSAQVCSMPPTPSALGAGVGGCLVLGPLVPVGSQHLAVLPPLAYQPGSLPGASPHTMVGRKPHLGAGFPLRCFQRLSLPNVANQPCTWRYNWHTRGSSIPVLSYWGRPSTSFLRAQRIGTELSHDVLNPARVPL